MAELWGREQDEELNKKARFTALLHHVRTCHEPRPPLLPQMPPNLPERLLL